MMENLLLRSPAALSSAAEAALVFRVVGAPEARPENESSAASGRPCSAKPALNFQRTETSPHRKTTWKGRGAAISARLLFYPHFPAPWHARVLAAQFPGSANSPSGPMHVCV